MHLRACFLSISINVLQYRLSISLTFGNDRYCPSFFSFRSAVFAALEIYSAISASNPGNQSMSRYNMRTLRGERVVKKKEGDRIKRWESDYERFVKDARNVLSVEKVRAEIAQTFEDNAIEHEKVSLICPLTKERIGVPARYRNCRHLQCFDLEGFFAMKSKKNFLNCPICNNIVNNAIDGLCIDKFFQNILSAVSGTTEINIFGDGTFRMTPSHSTLIIPKVIDDEGPYVPEHSTALACEVKSESGSDIEELSSVSSFDNDSESNECNAETQDLHLPDTSMAADTSQAVDPAENIYESKLESDSNVDNAEKLDSVSSFDIDSENNESDAEIQIMRVSDTSMATDTSQAAHSSNAKAPKSKIGEKRFKCDHCAYSAKNSHHLLAHTRIHTGEKPFKCTQCSYESATAVRLRNHMRTHSDEKPHKCDQCSFASAQYGNLQSHMRTHTGEKPYKCKICSYACAQFSNLKVHMRIHTDEKPHKCSQCSFASAQAINLAKHIRTHTGEKPYKCNQCSFASAQPDGLKRHTRTHTGEKPYKCTQCSYACARSSYMKTHIRTHTGEKPLKCSQCSYACARADNLKSHMRTHV